MPRLGQLGQDMLPRLVPALRAHGHLDHGIIAARAGARGAHAGAAVLGLDVLLVAVIDQGVEVFHRLDHHVAALAAVAAVGTAIFDEFLAPEADTTVPALAAEYVDLGLIEKFHDTGSLSLILLHHPLPPPGPPFMVPGGWAGRGGGWGSTWTIVEKIAL